MLLAYSAYINLNRMHSSWFPNAKTMLEAEYFCVSVFVEMELQGISSPYLPSSLNTFLAVWRNNVLNIPLVWFLYTSHSPSVREMSDS